MKTQKVRMQVSIASADWSYQPGQVVELDSSLAKQWRDAGHCVFVNGTVPLTDFSGRDGLADLDAEEARRRVCSRCGQRRGVYALRNRAFCGACFRAELGG